jgi:hypothetical protein
MECKSYKNISACVFGIAFVVIVAALEYVKPEFVLKKKSSSYVDDKKEVDHVAVMGYSIGLALAASMVYVLVQDMFGKQSIDKNTHSSFVVIAVFIIAYVGMVIIKPKAMMKDGVLDRVKVSMYALVIAVILGIVNYMFYDKKSKFYITKKNPNEEKFYDAEFGKSHYKMSFPGRSCGM